MPRDMHKRCKLKGPTKRLGQSPPLKFVTKVKVARGSFGIRMAIDAKAASAIGAEDFDACGHSDGHALA